MDGTTYTVGASFGTGKIAYQGSNYVFKIGSLTAGVNYYIFVFSTVKGCGAGAPFYSSNSLSGNIVTFSGGAIPAGYYDAAAGKTCDVLKTALFNIIKPTVANPDPTYKGILGSMTLTDSRINDNGTKFILWDQYSDNPAGPEPYEFTFGSPYQDRGLLGNNEGERYNREHTFPQGWFGGQVDPMYSDLFIVYPADKKMNGIRANSPYGQVGSASFTSLNGSKSGNNISSPLFTNTVFEPINEYKGDVARANLYVATAYEDKISAWQGNVNADDVLDGTAYPAFDTWYIQLLYQWHVLDPVSAKEIARNNNVYMIQGNRNPYIDHPEYVALVWQCTGVIPVTLIDFKATSYNESVILNWYATREANFKNYEIERSVDGINFSKVGNIRGQNFANYSFTDGDLPNVRNVFYRLKLVDLDGKSNYSKIISVKLNNNLSNAIIYPNPATEALSIKLQQALTGSSSLRVSDIAGRIVLQQMIPTAQNNILLDVHALPPGRYFVTIKNSSELINESFVIVAK